MPNYITILPEQLANQIAAGEVIERPASVVKELVENSIDAEADSIEISVEGAGVKSIRVADNGRGMSADDALNCLERHATSKIQTTEDLTKIHTLGFRGEALPSIASVSRMEILTRQKDDLSGTFLSVRGGKLKDVKSQGAPIGTTVMVRQLFFNIPARRKFLKSAETELRHITRSVMLSGLSHPNIGFRLLHNDRERFNLPKANDLMGRILTVFGTKTADHLIPISGEHASVSLRGYIGRPNLTRKSRQDQLTFVNGRPFYNSVIHHAIREGYATAMPHGRYPFTVLFLDLSPRMVDVNVHPTKREVRFGQERLIHDFLSDLIRQTLLEPPFSRSELTQSDEGLADSSSVIDQSPPPKIPQSTPRPAETNQTRRGLWDPHQKFRSDMKQPVLPLRSSSAPSKTEGENEPNILGLANQSEPRHKDDSNEYFHLNNLIQINKCYIIAPVKSGFWVIDQHAAHERIMFEHARKSLRENLTQSQQLLFPLTLELNPSEFQIVQEYHELFEKLGFGIRFFGGSTVVIDSVPISLKNSQEEQIFRDMIEDLCQYDATKLPVEDHILATYACHTSVRAGQELTQAEMGALIDTLFSTPQPFVCPHGRPIILQFTYDELEKRFGRH
ncbi:MAG: hypothetical protein B6244_05050 [Candidatus Cloacimonetes bacterium 4572_55]|nr:MAG: hypothetical protein B6244_05050 [Candidatus Cloacimonetes bacterium 4572_55]